MAVLTLPTIKRLTDYSFDLIANTVDHTSPVDKSSQTVAFPGQKWNLRAALPPMRAEDGGEEWRAFMSSLEGGAGRFHAGDGRLIAPRGAATTIAARSNKVPNNTMAGAVVGTVGSGGSLPTGWGWVDAGFATVSVDAFGQENGHDFIELTFGGTNSSGSTLFPVMTMTPTDSIAAAQSQTWTSSIYAKQIVALSHSLFDNIDENDSGGVGITNSLVALAITTTLTRFSHSYTLPSAGAAFVGKTVLFAVPDTEALSGTVRLYLPMLEQSATLSPPLRTFGTARDAPLGPFVEGASQSGKSLAIGGFTPSASGMLLIGDYCHYDLLSGNRTLHKLTAALPATDVTGVATASVVPPILEAPEDLAAITLAPATCVMHLIDDDQARVRIDRRGFYHVAFEAEEIFDGVIGS